jgi:uncharacterized damage-inducible protein DinB
MNSSEAIKELEKLSIEIKDTFGSLNPDKLNFKPAENVWSVSENLLHIGEVNQSYFPVFKDLEKGNKKLPFIAKIPFIVGLFGKMILGSVNPDRSRKMKTFAIWEPGNSDSARPALDFFLDSQDKLIANIKANAKAVDSEQIISSPANKNIVYKLSVALEIIINHEKRHINQAKEVLLLVK